MPTNQVNYNSVHNKFKLNGFHLNREDLLRVAYSFIKEGEHYEKPVGEFLTNWFDSKDYLEIPTSGTTGEPKIIKLSKQAMVNSALATGNFFDLKPGDKALVCLPVKYIAGKMMFVRSFILGLDLDFVEPNSRPLQFSENHYDFCAMVPLQAQHSLDSLHRIKTLIVGGSYITDHLRKQLLEIPINIFETYGMTETVSHIAARKLNEENFTVFPNVMISQNNSECLVIKAPHISNEVIETNDLIKLVNEQQFCWLGRIDNVVNSGGVKLIPELIESKLTGKIPRRYFLCGQNDSLLGEKLILIVEGEPMSIDQSIFNELDPYEKPKDIHFVKNFVETATSKIMRKETLDRFYM